MFRDNPSVFIHGNAPILMLHVSRILKTWRTKNCAIKPIYAEYLSSMKSRAGTAAPCPPWFPHDNFLLHAPSTYQPKYRATCSGVLVRGVLQCFNWRTIRTRIPNFSRAISIMYSSILSTALWPFEGERNFVNITCESLHGFEVCFKHFLRLAGRAIHNFT